MPEKHLLFVHPAGGPTNQVQNGDELSRVLDQRVEWIGVGVAPGGFRMCGCSHILRFVGRSHGGCPIVAEQEVSCPSFPKDVIHDD